MRSKTQVENELFEAKEKLRLYQMDVANYDGSNSAERYMFLTSINQIIREYSLRVQQLESEIEQYSKHDSVTGSYVS